MALAENLFRTMVFSCSLLRCPAADGINAGGVRKISCREDVLATVSKPLANYRPADGVWILVHLNSEVAVASSMPPSLLKVWDVSHLAHAPGPTRSRMKHRNPGVDWVLV